MRELIGRVADEAVVLALERLQALHFNSMGNYGTARFPWSKGVGAGLVRPLSLGYAAK